MWILIQIRRFFAFLSEEFFLFKKNFIVRKNANKIKPVANGKTGKFFKKKYINKYKIPVEIKLDKKYYDFHDLQKVDKSPFYLNSPLFLIIKRNKNEILNNLIEIFNNLYDFQLKIGLELEFYILNNARNIDLLKEFKTLFKSYIQNVEAEKGSNQFEIKTEPYTDILKLIKDYNLIIKNLNQFCVDNDLKLTRKALPFANDCGNSLQINISLEKQGKNLFSRTKINNNLTDSLLMLNCIGGLLKNINNNLLLYINNKSCLNRFNLETNVYLKNNNKYPAPTFISWGINNRTTTVRVPTPSSINLQTYMETDNKQRRVEFRVPSADADIKLVLIGIISSMIEGIENNLTPDMEKTSFDVLEKNSNLEKIETNFNELNNNFKINEDLLFF